MAKKRHAFNFPGGEQLTTIGASFFISYLYSQYVDPAHSGWTSIGTKAARIRTITRSKQHHRAWLEQVSQMNETNLSRNTMGLRGENIKAMAQALLAAV
jgi:hypothetical protein